MRSYSLPLGQKIVLSDLFVCAFAKIPIVSSRSVLGRVKTEYLLRRDAHRSEFVFFVLVLLYNSCIYMCYFI